MTINETIKSRTDEKKECKVTNNGVIWLKKGVYGNRIVGKNLEPKINLKAPKTANELLIIKQQKLEHELVKLNRNGTTDGSGSINGTHSVIEKRKTTYAVNKRKVRNRLTNFVNTQQGCNALYFYSISFPPVINYEVAYSSLNSVLTSLRSRYNLKHYLWIAERQKNGTIHYHIAIFQYIKVRIINELFKGSLRNAIANGNLDWSYVACNKYNGVDISKDRITRKPTNYASAGISKKISQYLTKYISKSNERFSRQAWNSSRTLAAVSDGIAFSVYEVCRMFGNDVLCDTAYYANDFCMFFAWIESPPIEFIQAMYDINTDRVAKVA